MTLECTCNNINIQEWERLMRGSKPINYEWLIKKIKKKLPNLYQTLGLNYYNPYRSQCKVTKTHYILVHSSIEYFITKN